LMTWLEKICSRGRSKQFSIARIATLSMKTMIAFYFIFINILLVRVQIFPAVAHLPHNMPASESQCQ
jgi:hypothetical protein